MSGQNVLSRQTLDHKRLLKLAKMQGKTTHREPMEKIGEGYLNNKEKLQANRQKKISSEEILKTELSKRLVTEK